MSILVSGIRQPFGEPKEQAVEAACKQCGLAPGQVTGSVYRVSIDARHGKIHQVYTILLDGATDEAALVERLQSSQIRL